MGLDMKLVYGFVSNKGSIDQMIEERALEIASIGLLEKVKIKNSNYYMNNSLIECLTNSNVRKNEIS